MTTILAHRPSAAAIRQAREMIADTAIRTPMVRLPVVGPAEIWLKLETLQPVGSFKIRGARNAIGALSRRDLEDGIYTASAGNMALGLAWCAQERDLRFTAIVPDHAPEVKTRAVERLGGRILRVPFHRWWQVLVEHHYEGMRGKFIHPVSDPAVIAGNASVGAEIAEDLPEVNHVLVPFGGGGLVCGIAAALRTTVSHARILACEIATATPLSASLEAKECRQVDYTPSFVDGIGSASLLPEMWELVRRSIHGVVVVTLEETAAAIRMLVERVRVVAEGAGAVSVAAALGGKVAGGTICCVVSGGNINPQRLAAILTSSEGGLG